ncbi:MAG: right-handed parallel beta-helix repeat-containing protein [Planctomycetes bacterium]|nr:right-handed parallel beta-helix repeat-containing protein [Planctomycetota bacterium]
MRRIVNALAITLILLAVSPTYGATLLVPTNYPTIQAALDAALDGDSVVVEPGTYFESVVVPEISITLLSESDDPFNTILDGTGNAAEPAMVYFPGDSAGTRELRGFTLRNSEARAVDIQDILFSPDYHIIQNCRFIDNGPGTPLHAAFGTCDILNNEFRDNGGARGGGAVVIRGPGSISGNVFLNNAALPDSTSTLTVGGAIFMSSTFPTGRLVEITNNRFEDNYSTDYGGAIWANQDYDIRIANNTFLRNVADVCAGAIYVVANKDTVVIEDNVFAENSSPVAGTIGVDFNARNTVIRNNTIVSTIGGAGILIHESFDIVVENNIVAFGDSYGIRWLSNPPVTIVSGIQQCNDAYSNPSGDYVITGTMVTSSMNISVDPLFCGMPTGNFELLTGSPCLPANNSCGVLMGALPQGCDVPTGIPETPLASGTLDQNYPNPFNPSTRIPFALERTADVYLAIYDVSGKLVQKLVDRRMSPGFYIEEWNGRDTIGHEVASGVYFYRLKTEGFSETRKMVLLK